MEFISLQLPLYAILLRKDPFFAEKYPFLDLENIKIECGYFNLPKAVTSTEIKIWTAIDSVLEKAEEKVWEIAEELKKMKEKIFKGNPDKKMRFDDFADLFQQIPSRVLRGVKFPDVMFDPEIRDQFMLAAEEERKKKSAGEQDIFGNGKKEGELNHGK